mmetsp:Transcript_15284/g.49981  ORF Transcript_15284/g.49981 Transcript_15284/m.49981 type:complete len:387 (+) Transcript_15284:622-1782(+)
MGDLQEDLDAAKRQDLVALKSQEAQGLAERRGRATSRTCPRRRNGGRRRRFKKKDDGLGHGPFQGRGPRAHRGLSAALGRLHRANGGVRVAEPRQLRLRRGLRRRGSADLLRELRRPRGPDAPRVLSLRLRQTGQRRERSEPPQVHRRVPEFERRRKVRRRRREEGDAQEVRRPQTRQGTGGRGTKGILIRARREARRHRTGRRTHHPRREPRRRTNQSDPRRRRPPLRRRRRPHRRRRRRRRQALRIPLQAVPLRRGLRRQRYLPGTLRPRHPGRTRIRLRRCRCRCGGNNHRTGQSRRRRRRRRLRRKNEERRLGIITDYGLACGSHHNDNNNTRSDLGRRIMQQKNDRTQGTNAQKERTHASPSVRLSAVCLIVAPPTITKRR